MRARHTVAQLLEVLGDRREEMGLSGWQLGCLTDIRTCRTAELGGHIDRCSEKACGHLRMSYNSCRNRHCPKCQGSTREKWISARVADLIPVQYYHVVFTLPVALNGLAILKPRLIYATLFKVAWSVIRDFGRDEKHLGALTGMIAVLHTWGQQLSLHPHLHCIVPGGGITEHGKWKDGKGKGKFLFPVRAMRCADPAEVSVVFRARFMEVLRKEVPELIDRELGRKLMRHKWVVYAKRPFNGPGAVIEYLGRYTHKIAISDHRIEHIAGDAVRFAYTDYRHGDRKKSMTLSTAEFIRQFAMHAEGDARSKRYLTQGLHTDTPLWYVVTEPVERALLHS